MSYTLQNSEYLADIELVASVMGTPDLMSLLHKTSCHDDPATDSYILWQYLQCTYQNSAEHAPQPETDGVSVAVMQQRASVLHWVGYLKNKIQNHQLANMYPLQETYGLYQEDVDGFMNTIHCFRELASQLVEPTEGSSLPVSVPCLPDQESPTKKHTVVRRSARLAKKKDRPLELSITDVVRGC
jgi:hypothetical protein